MTETDREDLAAAIARMLDLIRSGELEADGEQVAWLHGYLTGLRA